MNKKAYLFEGGHFGQQCQDDPFKEYRRLWKDHIRSRNPAEPEYYWRQHCYRTHKERVGKAEPAISDDSPVIPTVHLVSKSNFNRRFANMVKQERNNSLLLKNIQKIYTEKGSIDNCLNTYTKSLYDTNKIRQNKILAETYENSNIFRKLQAVKPTISRSKQIEWYAKQRKYMDLLAKFPSYINSRTCAPFEKLAWAKANENPRPIIYMDIEATDILCGRICFELFADICPMTCENFRSMCAADRGISYVCASITHIRPGIFWRAAGDSGLTNIYGESFPNENFRIKHDQPGILCMTNHGPKTNNVEFQINARALPPLNGNFVAFGHVVRGMEFLEELAKKTKPTESGKLRITTKITACGVTNWEKIEKIPPPKLYKSQKEELLLQREIKKILQMRRKIQDLKAELDDIDRKPSLASSPGSVSDSGDDATGEDTN